MEPAWQAEYHCNLAPWEGLLLSPWVNTDSQRGDAFHRYLLILRHTRPCAGDTALQEVCHPRDLPPPTHTH